MEPRPYTAAVTHRLQQLTAGAQGSCLLRSTRSLKPPDAYTLANGFHKYLCSVNGLENRRPEKKDSS